MLLNKIRTFCNEFILDSSTIFQILFCLHNPQISEIVPQFQIVIKGELGNAKGMLFAQHEMSLVCNLVLLHSTLQTSFLTKHAA